MDTTDTEDSSTDGKKTAAAGNRRSAISKSKEGAKIPPKKRAVPQNPPEQLAASFVVDDELSAADPTVAPATPPKPLNQGPNENEIAIEAALEQAHAIERQLQEAHQNLRSSTCNNNNHHNTTALAPTPPPPMVAPMEVEEIHLLAAAKASPPEQEVDPEIVAAAEAALADSLKPTPPTDDKSVGSKQTRKGYFHGILLRKCSCEFPEDCKTITRHWCEPVEGSAHRDPRRAGYLEIPWFREYASTEHTLYKNQQRQVYLTHIKAKKTTPLEGAANNKSRTYIALHHFHPDMLRYDGKGLVDWTVDPLKSPDTVSKLKLKKMERINIPGHVQHNTYFVPPSFKWKELVDAFAETGGDLDQLKQIVPAVSQKQAAAAALEGDDSSYMTLPGATPGKLGVNDHRYAHGIPLRKCECAWPEDCRKLVAFWCEIINDKTGKRRDGRRAGYTVIPPPQENANTPLRKYKQAKREVYFRHLTGQADHPGKKRTGTTGWVQQFVALHHFPVEFLNSDGSGLKNEVADSRFVERLIISKEDAVPKNDGFYYIPPCYDWNDLREEYIKQGGIREHLSYYAKMDSPKARADSPDEGIIPKNRSLQKPRIDPGLKTVLRKMEQDKEAFARDFLALEKQAAEMKEDLKNHKQEDGKIQKELDATNGELEKLRFDFKMFQEKASKGLSRQNVMSDEWHKRFPEAASILLGFSDWGEFKFFVTRIGFSSVQVEEPEGRITEFEKIFMAVMKCHKSYDFGIIGLIFGHNRRRVGEWVAKYADQITELLEAEQKKSRSRNFNYHLAPSVVGDEQQGPAVKKQKLGQSKSADKPLIKIEIPERAAEVDAALDKSPAAPKPEEKPTSKSDEKPQVAVEEAPAENPQAEKEEPKPMEFEQLDPKPIENPTQVAEC